MELNLHIKEPTKEIIQCNKNNLLIIPKKIELYDIVDINSLKRTNYITFENMIFQVLYNYFDEINDIVYLTVVPEIKLI
jgi:hypothetical protein